MKRISLIFLLFFCVCTYSQTMTEKYNSYLNRYEYFDANGNLTGYKSYNSYLGVWEYFSENANTYNRKPIEYAKPPTDNNFALLQQVVNQKQNSYNSNQERVKNYLAKVVEAMNGIENSEIRKRIKNRYNLEIIDFLNSQRFDVSNNNTAQQVLDFIHITYNNIITEEFKKYN